MPRRVRFCDEIEVFEFVVERKRKLHGKEKRLARAALLRDARPPRDASPPPSPPPSPSPSSPPSPTAEPLPEPAAAAAPPRRPPRPRPRSRSGSWPLLLAALAVAAAAVWLALLSTTAATTTPAVRPPSLAVECVHGGDPQQQGCLFGAVRATLVDERGVCRREHCVVRVDGGALPGAALDTRDAAELQLGEAPGAHELALLVGKRKTRAAAVTVVSAAAASARVLWPPDGFRGDASELEFATAGPAGARVFLRLVLDGEAHDLGVTEGRVALPAAQLSPGAHWGQVVLLSTADREVAASAVVRWTHEPPWADTALTTELWRAVAHGSVAEVAQLLDRAPHAVHARSSDGRGPLWWAAEHGRRDVAALLRRRGADSALRDGGGKRPRDLW